MKENFAVEYFDVVLFMKQKQRRNEKEYREKNKEGKENMKKDRKEERKKRRRVPHPSCTLQAYKVFSYDNKSL